MGLLLLASCQQHEAPVSESPAQTVTPVSPPSPAVDEARARADFTGAWLNAAYMARLRQTRSPRQSHGHWGPTDVTEVLIDPRSLQGNNLRVEMGYGNHEGGPLRYLRLPPGYAGALLPAAAEPSLGIPVVRVRFHVQGDDTLMYLHEAAGPGQRARISAFRRVPGLPVAGDNLRGSMERFIHLHTLAGWHAATDSAGRGFPVQFSPEGKVTGWPGHRRYGVNFDFVGPFQEHDYLVFDQGHPTEEQLAFVTRGDTVRLYRVVDDTTVYKRSLGSLRFTLVRQKK